MSFTLENNDQKPEDDGPTYVAKPRMSHGILSLVMPEKKDIYNAFMPFIKGGGLFIETNRTFHLGEEVFALLQIVDDEEKTPITGKVVWLTPKAPQNNRKQGIGIQISAEDSELTKRIEAYLAGYDQEIATRTL